MTGQTLRNAFGVPHGSASGLLAAHGLTQLTQQVVQTTTTGPSISDKRVRLGLAWMICWLAAMDAKATIGPPIKIRMPEASAPAVSGQAYSGVFEVQVGAAGTIRAVKLTGKGWNVLSLGVPGAVAAEPGRALIIPFRAIPADPRQPLRISLEFDGRRIARRFTLSAEVFARRGQARALARTGPAAPVAASAPASAGLSPQGGPCGAQLIHFTGRFVYTRQAGSQGSPPPLVVGADSIRVEIRDDDGVDGHDVMWSGLTDVNGYFDIPVCWDDSDLFESGGPDIYVYFETDTDVVAVQEDSLFEPDYSWSTFESPGVMEDFTDSFLDFGTLTPGDPAHYPAIHIFNSIVRAHRFILTRDGTNVERVEVLWPESDTGAAGAFYDPSLEEIHVRPISQWKETVHVHEYGHHFLENYAATLPSGYCNGFCDGPGGASCSGDPEECSDPGHCQWCPETDHSAFNEGWSDWLADAVTRSFPGEYELTPGVPYEPLYWDSQEPNSRSCCNQIWDPLVTQGFVSALLRDIEDFGEFEDFDQGLNGQGPPDPGRPIGQPGCARDALSLGTEEILQVVRLDLPVTVAEFIAAFGTRFPQHSTGLWKTANSIGGAAYTWPDTQPPGPAAGLISPTHPIGIGGRLPVIHVNWEEAPDDASGAEVYAVAWATTPEGSPFFTQTIDDRDPATGEFRAVSPPLGLGEYWFRIQARDCAGHWSDTVTFFGPLVIDECNANGIVDLCEIPAGCNLYPGLCPPAACDTLPDCNGGGVPDACDIASGTSEDCNTNDIPDECEAVAYVTWSGCVNCGCPVPDCTPIVDCTWDGVNCWDGFAHSWNPAPPGPGDHVCIENVPGSPQLDHRTGNTSVRSIGCYERFKLSAGTLSVTERSAFYHTYNQTAGTFTSIADQDMHGLFEWSGGVLAGGGRTVIRPGAILNMHGGDKELGRVLENRSLNAGWTGGTLFFNGGTLNNSAGSLFTVNSTAGLTMWLRGGANNAVYNAGTFDKQGSARLTVGVGGPIAFNNSGTVNLQAGELRLLGGGISSGAFNGAAGTVLIFSSGAHLLTGDSSIHASAVTLTDGQLTVEGVYETTAGTTVSGGHLAFTPAATLMSVGEPLTISGGTADFSSGAPISVGSFVQSNGTLTGSSDVHVTQELNWSRGTMSGTGKTAVMAGATLNMGGGLMILERVLENHSALAEWTSNPLHFDGGGVNNLAGGIFKANALVGLSMFLRGGINNAVNNAGRFIKTGPNTLVVGVGGPIAFNNAGTLEVEAGILDFRGPFVQTDGETLLNGGGIATSHPLSIQGGVLRGNGLITGSVSNAGGTVAPGVSAGTLTITAAYVNDGTLDIELGGPAAGSEFDQLQIGGAATLGGTLRVTLINGFSPSAGDTFTVMTYGSRSGAFSERVGLCLGNGLTLQLTYDPASLILQAVAGSIPGDFDCDDDVDRDDLLHLQQCSGRSNVPHGNPVCNDADLDSDADIDGDDFGVFQRCYRGTDVPADPNCA